MKNTRGIGRVFLDTNVLLSGLNSATGASAAILALGRAGEIMLIISPEVLDEARAVIGEKFPFLTVPLLDVASSIPAITKPLTARELREARRIIPTEDAPIFGGARKAKTDVLVTLDKTFYAALQRTTQVAATPREFMERYRAVRGRGENQ